MISEFEDMIVNKKIRLLKSIIFLIDNHRMDKNLLNTDKINENLNTINLIRMSFNTNNESKKSKGWSSVEF